MRFLVILLHPQTLMFSPQSFDLYIHILCGKSQFQAFVLAFLTQKLICFPLGEIMRFFSR